MISAAGLQREAVHRILNDRGARPIERVDRLARLEKDVWVLRGAAEQRMFRGQPAVPMLSDKLFINKRAKVVILEHFDLV